MLFRFPNAPGAARRWRCFLLIAGLATAACIDSPSRSTEPSLSPTTAMEPRVPLAWWSDWRTSTGMSTEAIRDGGKWNGELCQSPVAAVVPADSLDFPAGMANVFRSEYHNWPGSGVCRMIQVSGLWSPPAVGQSIYYRIYYRNAVSNGANLGQAHPLQNGDLAWWFGLRRPEANRSLAVWHFPNQPYPNVKFYLSLPTNQTWRWEWRLFRESAATVKVTLRIYDAAGNLSFTNDDWKNDTGQSLTSQDPDLAISDENSDFGTLQLGNNDPNTTIGPGEFVYWGGAAVSLTDWVGPYTPDGG